MTSMPIWREVRKKEDGSQEAWPKLICCGHLGLFNSDRPFCIHADSADDRSDKFNPSNS